MSNIDLSAAADCRVCGGRPFVAARNRGGGLVLKHHCEGLFKTWQRQIRDAEGGPTGVIARWNERQQDAP